MHDYSKTETLPAGSGALRTVSVTYQDKPVRYFIWASIIFGVVAMLAGVLAALQLSHWQANLGLE